MPKFSLSLRRKRQAGRSKHNAQRKPSADAREVSRVPAQVQYIPNTPTNEPPLFQQSNKEKHDLFLLHPLGEKEESTKLDIVAIHGLMGDYSETWTKDGLCWLRDSRLLPSKLPNARILSFGYNASLALTKSKADTHDIALDLLNQLALSRLAFPSTRPIVLVCHSLGGIIAKQALVIAHDDENEFSDLLNAVRGIAFLGVPNRGSQIASYADTLLSIICPGPGRMLMDPSLLCFLKAHSQQLQHLSDSAKWRLWNVPYIYSFYETEVTARMKIVVGKDSATIGLAHEKTIPVTADHGNICKFNASESKRYEAVSGHIQRMVNKIMDTSTQFTGWERKLINKIYIVEPNSMLRRYGLPYGPGLSRLSTAPDWVFRHPTYEGWLENENPCVLWITGRLGCGKSTLSTSIVEALRGKELVCYHFFGPEDPRQQTAHAFIRGFLHQIISSSKDLLECFSDKYGARGEPLLDDLEELWAVCSSCLRILEQHNTIILVLDGLEKCVEKELKAVLRYLSDIIGLVTCQIKVIVTSNAHVLIRDSLGYIAKKKDRMIFQTIDHDDDQVLELVEHAVHRYIDLTIAELPALSKWTQEQHEQLGSILKDRADGTYLWVSMILRAIPSWGDTSEQNLEKLLWDVPADLGQTYTTMFNLLPEQSSMRSDLFKILLGALEPLSLLQLRDCLTASSCVTFKDQPLEKNLSKRRQPDIERTIKIFCGSFVHITDGFCYFAHSTAREFIFEKISGKEYSVRYLCNSIIVGSIERYIWLLHLLEFSPFTRSKSRSLSGKHSVKDLRQRCSILTEKYPFLVYFRRHWFKYVLFIAGQPSGFRKLLPGAGPGSLKPDLVKLSLKRFTESPFLRVWWFIKMFYMTGAHDTAVVDIAQISGAHLRAYYGFDLSESDCERVTSLPVLGYNLLHCAVLGKQQPTVSWLLKTMTSSPYQMDAWKRTPLHLAASRNAIELVEMLMIYPSTLEAQDYNYETPLDYAESCGLTDTAAILHSWREYIQAEEQTGGSLPYSKIYLYFQDFAQVSGHDFSRRTIDHIESLIWEETDDQEVEEMSRALIKIHNEEPFEYSPSNARFRSRSSDSNLMQHDRSQSRGSSIDSVSRHLRRHRSSRSRRGSTGSGSSSDSSGLKRSSSRGSSIDSVRRI